MTQKLRRWVKASVLSTIGLIICISSTVLFLYGHALYGYFDSIGKYLILLSMCLLPITAFIAGLTFIIWRSSVALRERNMKYCPPTVGASHRT